MGCLPSLTIMVRDVDMLLRVVLCPPLGDDADGEAAAC